MSDLSDPEKYEMATIVTKNSKTGITSNKRLLVIKKGHLYYYSSVPKQFKSDTKFLQTYHELPKCSIELLNIKKINGFQSNSNYFSIEFEARHMMERQDIRKTMTLQQFNFAPKNTKQMITWQFTCDNQFIKQKWVHALETLHAHYSKQKINIQKFFQNINKKQEDKSLAPPVRSSLMVPWREDQIKKSGSNDNLRKSYLINPRVSTSRVPSIGKKSVSSDQKSPPPQMIKTNSAQDKNVTTQQIIESFMKKQKMRQHTQAPIAVSLPVPQTIVIQESLEQSIRTPSKDDFSSSRKNLISTKMLKPMELQQSKNNQNIKSQPKLNQSILNVQKKQSFQFVIVQSHQIQLSPDKKNEITKEQEKIIKPQSIIQQNKIQRNIPQKNKMQSQQQQKQKVNEKEKEKEQDKEKDKDKNKEKPKEKTVPKQLKKVEIKAQKHEVKQQKQQHKSNIIKQYKQNTKFIHKLQQQLKQLPSVQKISQIQTKNERNRIHNQLINKIQYKVGANTLFYELFYFGINRQYTFQKRIEAQQMINSMIGSFTDKSLRSFTQFVGLKASSSGRMGRFSEQKIDETLSFIQIGYTKYKIGYVSTQTISINEKQKIFYNQAAVKSIKRQMRVYNKLNEMIVNKIKNMNSTKQQLIPSLASLSLSLTASQVKSESSQAPKISTSNYPAHIKVTLDQLRVPLCTYFEYKGICAMAYDETNANLQKQLTDKQMLNQWRELMRFLGFNSNCFEFKTMQTAVGELVIAYIISANDIYLNAEPFKHHNVSFQSPMNTQFLKKAKKQGASTSVQSLLKYIKTIKSIKDTQMFSCPRDQIITTLQYCYLCKFLRKFYRASQAQLDQLKFINLLLSGDKNIINLFDTSGFQFQLKKQNSNVIGIFFQFLLYYLGITCQVDPQKLQKFGQLPMIGIKKQINNSQKIIKGIKIQARVQGLDLSYLQLYETFAKLNKYIINKNRQLAHKTLQIKELTYFQNVFQPGMHPWPAAAQCIFESSQLNFMQNDFITSIAKCKQFLCLVSPTFVETQEDKWHSPAPSNCIPTYFLMTKCYSKFSREKMNQTLTQMIESTIYNFGENSSMIITVFSFGALTYSSIGEYSQAQLFLQTGIKIGQKLFAPYKKSRLAQLYLDLGRILLIQNKINQANKYIEKAQKIIQLCGTYEQKLNLLLFMIQLSAKGQNSIQSQEKAMHLIFAVESLLKKQQTKFSTLKQLYHFIFKIGTKFNRIQICQKSIQQLWQLDTTSKILAVELAYVIINDKFQNISSQYHNIMAKWSLSKQKSVLLLEENLKHYPNFLQMINQIFAEKDTELLSAFFKILPLEALRIK